MSGQPHEEQHHDAHSFEIAQVKQRLLKGVARIPHTHKEKKTMETIISFAVGIVLGACFLWVGMKVTKVEGPS